MQREPPNGIVQLLLLAAAHEELALQVEERALAVAKAAGIALTATERRVLHSLPPGELTRMARQLPPLEPSRRAFLHELARTAAAGLGLGVLGATHTACPGREPAKPPVDKGAADRVRYYGLKGPSVMADPALADSLPTTDAGGPRAVPARDRAPRKADADRADELKGTQVMPLGGLRGSKVLGTREGGDRKRRARRRKPRTPKGP